MGPATQLLEAPEESRQDHHHHRSQWVPRFGASERLLHWWIVTMFGAALLTGLAMGDEAESGPLLTLHVGAVVMIGVGALVALLVGNRRAIVRSAWELLVFDRNDVAWVTGLVRHPLHRRAEPRWGKFNTGQKVLAWSLIGSLAALIWTGVQSRSSGGDAAGPHSAAVVIAVVLLCAHIFMAVVNPSTRPALPGMVFGQVRRTWAERHHGAWLAEVDQVDVDQVDQVDESPPPVASASTSSGASGASRYPVARRSR